MAPGSRQPGITDGRTLARRQRYDAAFAAAITLFVEQGYERTTMEAIAERTGASRASVFNYFPRKTAILTEWSRRRRAAVSRLMDETDTGSRAGLPTELLRYLDAWATINERSRAETIACGPASLRETDLLTDSGLSHELSRLFEIAAQRGETVDDLDVELAAHALAAAYFAVLARWIGHDGRSPDLRRELRTLAEIFLGGTMRRPLR